MREKKTDFSVSTLILVGMIYFGGFFSGVFFERSNGIMGAFVVGSNTFLSVRPDKNGVLIVQPNPSYEAKDAKPIYDFVESGREAIVLGISGDKLVVFKVVGLDASDRFKVVSLSPNFFENFYEIFRQ